MIHAKHLVIYWYSKGHKAEAINEKLKNSFGATAPPDSTVPYWCRKLKFKSDILGKLIWIMEFWTLSMNFLFIACVHYLEF
jgi:hypothetical protein